MDLDPDSTEPEFLPWLANWVALSLRADWNVATRRSFIGQIVPLYGLRGPKEGLRRMLRLYTGREGEIDDGFDQLPHYFPAALRRLVRDPGVPPRTHPTARDHTDK